FFEEAYKGFVDPAGTKNIDDAKQKVEGLDQALANLVRMVGPEAAGQAFDNFARSLGLSQAEIDALRPQLDAYNGALGESKLAADAAAIAQGNAAGATGELGGAMSETTALTEEQKRAQEELTKVHQSYADAAGGFVDPIRAWNEVVEEATTKAREHAEGVAASTADTTDSWEDYVVEASGSLDAFTAKLEGQIAAQDQWANNLKTIVARGRGDVVDELTLMGVEGAAIVAALADAEGAEMNRAADLIVEAGRRGSLEYGTELDIGQKVAIEILNQGATASVQTVMDALGPMPGLTAELVRSVAAGMDSTLADARPSWEAAWQGRRTISLGEMNALLAEAPPIVRSATDTINQHLIDTNPAFAAQFQSRHGVSVAEMQALAANAPPHVQAAMNLVNQHLVDAKPAYDFQWIERRVAAVREMAATQGLAPPIADETARLINNALGQHLPGYQFQYGERKNIANHEMGTAAIDAAVKAGAAGDGMNRELASRLPPFRNTVHQYQQSLVTGISTVTSATGNSGARRDTGPARPGIAAADGGIIEFYAAGGMKEAHQAQIARAGDWRVWAEPETGGEAYIPLALAKRQRSTDILTEVASRFGLVLRPAEEDEVLDYHQGGICGHVGCQHFHSGGLYVPPAHPQFNDYGEPIKPAGAGTTHAMREMVAARARAHMQEPHHTMPPPMAGGSFAGGGGGGHTLSRVQSIIGQFPGARITSTYRSPAQNAAVGGARNSLHMDRANPATDIGGPTGTLDAIHARLRSMGGWRELIWRAPGHYDHVHVAEEGSIFEQSFDSGGYLRPGYTLAYNGTGMPERVLNYAEGGLRGDTFYGDPGGRRAKRERFSDEDGAQFDYMNRRETRARRHEYLDYGTPHNMRDGLRPSDAYLNEWNSVKEMARQEDRMLERLGRMEARSGQAAPVMNVPINQSNDNSVNLSFSGPAVKVDVSAQVGADAGQLRNQVLEAVNQSFGAWTQSLTTEIRTRRR
ncbi:MAG TPA: D-Ala-D-Ala carboxypeptidase family metallohydrolase, partial [Acidimicrobiales bacterium]|nr:D-Ala-D-Ala carboxypeptidase family metallohydrolase [Acidimicrobiales bacterium]